MENTKHMHFTLTGRVQRVGMRFFISRTAKKLDLTGYVKNQRDGSVKGVVVGDDKVLDTFIHRVKEESPGSIDAFEYEIHPSDTDYRTFKVKHF